LLFICLAAKHYVKNFKEVFSYLTFFE